MGVGHKKIMIAAGGTGGHVFPGTTIADAIRRRDASMEIVFVGTKRGLEERICGSLGLRFVAVNAPKFKGRGTFAKAATILRIPVSLVSAMRIMASERPSLLISIGGYAAGPLSVAAWILGIPVTLLEPNAFPGLTNRIVARFAKIAFTAYDGMSRFFDPGKIVKSGIPVRREILAARRNEIADGQRITIFLFGGSQGAMRLNDALKSAAALLPDVSDRIRIIHQTGPKADRLAIGEAYRRAGIEASVFEFSDRIWECYAKADFVIARSGAGAVAELTALAIPSVLVPYPYAADDHQRANALALVRAGGAIMLADSECSGSRLAGIIRDMVRNPGELKRMRTSLVDASVPDAANIIVDRSLGLLA